MNRKQKGKGVIGRIVTALKEGPASRASPALEKFLDSHKDNKIVKMQLGRKPIDSKVHRILDALSVGNFSRAQKHFGYDKIYHNYILVTLDDGKTYKLEKNQTVVEKPVKSSDYANELYPIPVHRDQQKTVKDLIDVASKGNEKRFWKYRGGTDNCQQFTRDIIEKNGLLPEAHSFEHKHLTDKQNSTGLLNTVIPQVSGLPDAVTDLAAVGDRVWQGYGINFQRKKRKA